MRQWKSSSAMQCRKEGTPLVVSVGGKGPCRTLQGRGRTASTTSSSASTCDCCSLALLWLDSSRLCWLSHLDTDSSAISSRRCGLVSAMEKNCRHVLILECPHYFYIPSCFFNWFEGFMVQYVMVSAGWSISTDILSNSWIDFPGKSRATRGKYSPLLELSRRALSVSSRANW